jgi:hypothetical protein
MGNFNQIWLHLGGDGGGGEERPPFLITYKNIDSSRTMENVQKKLDFSTFDFLYNCFGIIN